LQPAKSRWFLSLGLALALAWPGLALGEATQGAPAAKPEERAASPPVEIIRGRSKTRVAQNSPASSPKAGGEIKPPRRIINVKIDQTPKRAAAVRSTPGRA